MAEQIPGIVPHLAVDGAAEAIAFYTKAFGATELGRMPADDGKRLMHAALQVNGGMIFLHDDFPEYCREGGASRPPTVTGGTAVTLHLSVPDCDAAFARAVDAGATESMAPHDAFWGDRYGEVTDPFGHRWSFAHPLQGKPG